jgi:HAE1 family hydrophobic/amphiphilic exporter-1
LNFSKPFIERPVATTIIMLALIIFGWVGYSKLPVSELPNIDFPTIVVSASVPGADPENMASTVAMPLEKSLSSIAGIDSMSSVSTSGRTSITLQFDIDRDIDAATQDVQAAISQAIRNLPSEMTTPPTLRKVNPSQSPILFMALTAEHLPLSVLNDYAESYLAQSLSMIPGVADVNVYGSQQYAVRIYLNPIALAGRKLGLDTVANAIDELSANLPSGLLESKGHYHLIKTNGQLNNAKAFNDSVIAVNNGEPVRLRDIGLAVDSVANDKVATWFNGKRAIALAIQKQPGTNTVEITKHIKLALPKLLKNIPGDVKVHLVSDKSEFIKASIKDVQKTLIFAIVLVLIITYLFFKNGLATLITTLDFPTSLIATFMVMYLLTYSLDNLSLMGLVLAVGFVIDDTIVVLENILRYLEQGFSRLQAALRATEEISFTVFTMTISLVAVFIPVLFMGGLIGRLFHEFAVVVGTAILFSGFVALTLTPMLRSRFVSVGKNETNILIATFTKYFDISKKWYLYSLDLAFKHAKYVWISVGIILGFTIILCYKVPKGFIPTEDMDLIVATTQVKEGVTFADFCVYQQEVTKIIEKNKNVSAIISNVGQGSGAASGLTNGQLIIQLKSSVQRKESVNDIIVELRKQLADVIGLQVFLQAPPSIKIGSSSIGSCQYILQGTDWQELRIVAQKFQKKLANISGINDLTSDLQLRNPEIRINISRDRAALLGVTPKSLETAIYMAYGGNKINTIVGSVDQYPVIMQIDPKYQQSIEELGLLNVRSSNDSMIPLNNITDIEEGVGPISVNHYSQLPAVTISFNLAPDMSLGTVAAQIEQLAKDTLPANISCTPVGTAKTFQNSMISLPMLLLFTIVVIYMVLAILYEHFIHPLTILTSLPLAAFGALLSLLLFKQELNIFSCVGIILLVGLVKKNGIIMVDFALEAKRQQNVSAKEAIIQACNIRYRPIMMTTLAALFSVLPLALGTGIGSAARRSLGIAVFGGLLFSQILTLYVTPLFYLTMENWIDKFNKQFTKYQVGTSGVAMAGASHERDER